MDRVINTEHLPEKERFDFWRDEISKQHLKYDLERIDAQTSFRAEMTAAILGDVVFGMARLSGVRGFRGEQHIADDVLDHYVLGIPANQSIVMQGGDEYALGCNEMVLFDGTRPLHYCHKDDGGGITVAIPRHYLNSRLAAAEVNGLRTASLEQGIGLLIRNFCQTLPAVMASSPTEAIRRGLAEQLASLISLAFQASDEGIERARPTISHLRFQAIKDFVDLNVQDPDLSPEHLVRAMGISRSYLYKLFADNDFGFQDYVRNRRLALAAMALRSPALTSASITDIAVRCGFNNTSHFSRCFRTHFGESPRAYRARMVNGAR